MVSVKVEDSGRAMQFVLIGWALRKRRLPIEGLPKCITGIRGLDEITNGGLPQGLPTLVCGGAGCRKTLLASEFMVHGPVTYDEPVVFIAF